MNCAPGDVAYLFKCPPAPSMIGTVVTVVDICPGSESDFPLWHFEESPLVVCTDIIIGVLVDHVHALPDEWLRPLRDRGGEDETLAWKPVPKIPEPVTS